MEKILYSDEAMGKILVECYKRGTGIETGLILIGPKNHKNIVTDVIESTVHAERQSFTYFQNESDVQILNKKLRAHQKKGLEYVGTVHRHPPGMIRLSQGDKKTSAGMLQSPNYKLDNHLIMSIITESNHHVGLPIFSYIVSLDDENKPVVKQASSKMLPKHCISECLECI